MSNLRRVTWLAVLFAVLLRMAIGWQFFYEGLWKYDSLNTARPWSSAGYLANARGPFRDHFRGMVPDPDGLDWLDYDKVSGRWDAWEVRFTEHYELTDDQKRQLHDLLDGPDDIVGKSLFPGFAEGLKIGGTFARENIIRAEHADDGRLYLVVHGEKHLTPSERNALVREGRKIEASWKKKANAAEEAGNEEEARRHTRQANLADAFVRAVEDVYKRNTRLGFREQLAAMLKGDPERVAQVREDQPEGSVDHKRPGKTEQYKNRLARYEEMLSGANQDFQQEHLEAESREIWKLRNELVGPVKKLEDDLKRKARGILTEEQLANGPIPPPPLFTLSEFSFADVGIRQIDAVTMWALMVFGGLLIVGLFSRTTAFLGALLVLSFYLVMPPWPGVPEAPGPEHALIVNKNLIEVGALLLLAALPTGKWFGVDAFFLWLFPGNPVGKRRKRQRGKSVSKKSALSPAERVVQSGTDQKEPGKQESGQKEPVKAAASKETYQIKSGDKSS